MGRAVRWIVLLGALYLGLTFFKEPLQSMFGGALKPVESVRTNEAPLADPTGGAATLAEPPSAPQRTNRTTETLRDRLGVQPGADR